MYGIARGLEIVDELNPVIGVHEYVCPNVEDAPRFTMLPKQMFASIPVIASGIGLTVTKI